MSKQKPNDYEKLRAIWYKKLEREGFNDIEQDEDNLKSWSSQFKRKVSLDSWQAKAAYYYMAESFLNDYKFESRVERIIWEYHANGISIRDIVKLLQKVRIKRHKEQVNAVIMFLRAAMKKMYTNVYDEPRRE